MLCLGLGKSLKLAMERWAYLLSKRSLGTFPDIVRGEEMKEAHCSLRVRPGTPSVLKRCFIKNRTIQLIFPPDVSRF